MSFSSWDFWNLPESVPQPGPHDVVFTQYLRPHGRQRTVWIDRGPDMATLARRVKEVGQGYHFDAEELQDGHVSLTIEPNQPDQFGDDSPIAQELVMNGPEVPFAVDRLIVQAATVLKLL